MTVTCVLSLLLLAVLADLTAGQLNIWAQRSMITEIMESLPPHRNVKRTPCPKKKIRWELPENFHFVKDGVVNREIFDKVDTMYKSIPPRINVIKVLWKSDHEEYWYRIRLQSLTESIMNKPLLDILSTGKVPLITSYIKLTLPCIGNASGFAQFSLELEICQPSDEVPGHSPQQCQNSAYQPKGGLWRRLIPKMIVSKHCLSNEEYKKLMTRCTCRAKCANAGGGTGLLTPRLMRGRASKLFKTCTRCCRKEQRRSRKKRRSRKRSKENSGGGGKGGNDKTCITQYKRGIRRFSR